MGSSLSVYDGLGRVIQTQLESDPQGIVYTDTTYDGLGRKHTVSNPYRSTSDSTYGLTTFGYDGLSRVITVTTSDSAEVTTDYRGNQVTVTDQAGKPRRSLTDALGRLTRVDEPNKDTGALGDVTSPVQPTSYSYDALDNLKTVTQGGQARSFSYDSLKRLTSATNPESGTVNYPSYDGNGNLLSKIDARGITTNYVYDALNRLTNKTYQNDPSSTPAVSYTYDATSVSNSKGRLTQVGSTVSMTNYTGYDAMGRVTASSQSTNGQTYLLGYGYNLAGGMTSETYPSGRVVNTNYDGAGRVNGVTGTGSRNYATSILYAPQGGMTSLALGNLLTESTAYNNRLQPTSISVGTRVSLGYAYGTSNNNGNVQSQTITAPGLSLTQTYGYDWLNRLTGMNETSGWSEAFSYDPYGNRTGGSSSSPYMPLQIPTINAQTNKISAANHSYDAAGNLTQGLGADGLVKTYTYDAENRLATFNGSAASYSYDGDGRRVKKVVGSATTVLVYDARGQMVAEYSNPAPPTSGGTSYVTADHLGSTRLVTDSTGAVIARHDYAPFGEEITSVIGGRSGVTGYGVDEGLRQKFTAKERDSETGLDYFGARYYGSNMGRFMSPDPVMVSWRRMVNPQIWNSYSYVGNNPLRFVDPSGEELVQLGQHTDDEIKKRQQEIKQELKNKDLSKDQKDALKKERNTLSLEKQGNQVVGNLLSKLDQTGQRNGLQLSNFTLSTDTKSDFAGAATPAAMQKLLNDQAFVIQNNKQFGGTIYIRTEPETGFYQLSQRSSDFGYFGASAISHEQVHLNGGGEYPAYQRQLGVFEGFHNFFQNQELYRGLDESIRDGIKANQPQ